VIEEGRPERRIIVTRKEVEDEISEKVPAAQRNCSSCRQQGQLQLMQALGSYIKR